MPLVAEKLCCWCFECRAWHQAICISCTHDMHSNCGGRKGCLAFTRTRRRGEAVKRFPSPAATTGEFAVFQSSCPGVWTPANQPDTTQGTYVSLSLFVLHLLNFIIVQNHSITESPHSIFGSYVISSAAPSLKCLSYRIVKVG